MMIDEDTGMKPATPWHLWLVGALAVLWNAMGAYGNVMTLMQNEAHFAQLTPEQVELFTTMPIWAASAYAIATWAALLGSILLLIKSRFATVMFGVSLVGMIISFFHNFALAGAGSVMNASQLVFTAAIMIIALALFLYARAMANRGVLG
ncbi:MAG: hypothetical protein AAF638_11840 [Pseudomonadota bacterium]